jgi:hypothetical protein
MGWARKTLVSDEKLGGEWCSGMWGSGIHLHLRRHFLLGGLAQPRGHGRPMMGESSL